MNSSAIDPNLILNTGSGEPEQTPVSEVVEAHSEPVKVAEKKPFFIPSAIDPNLLLCEISPLHVRLSSYAGPLDLLLDLIKQEEMDVYDINVSEVTAQYLESLATMRELDLEVAGEFLVMAATLLYIKSKMLLPTEDNEIEDEDGDPRDELVKKLLEYQAFKEAARELGMLEDERGRTFTRQISDYYLTELDPEDAGIDSFSADLYDLLSAFQKVLTRAKKELPHEILQEEVSIEEKIADIRSRLSIRNELNFSELFSANVTRNLLIVTFLALLELVKSKFIGVKQADSFGEIRLERREDLPVAQEF